MNNVFCTNMNGTFCVLFSFLFRKVTKFFLSHFCPFRPGRTLRFRFSLTFLIMVGGAEGTNDGKNGFSGLVNSIAFGTMFSTETSFSIFFLLSATSVGSKPRLSSSSFSLVSKSRPANSFSTFIFYFFLKILYTKFLQGAIFENIMFLEKVSHLFYFFLS